MDRLPCCTPTAIYPGSGTVGHGPLCDKAEIPLTPMLKSGRLREVGEKGGP